MGIKHLKEIEGNAAIQTIFVDFYDTLVHRTVHPNHVLRLWAKVMIRELGLNLKIDELYFLRKESSSYLAKKYNRLYYEIDYYELIAEVYNRLVATSKIKELSITAFTACFELSEIRSEADVQYLNKSTIDLLKALKKKKYNIYCISDFYTSAKILEGLIEYHEIKELIDNVFVSADYEKSKRTGNLYHLVLEKLDIDSSSALMIGDNEVSDVQNAKASGLRAIFIPNLEESKTKKRYLIGSDRKDYRTILKKLYKSCNSKNAPANSDYILYYAVYVERLYHKLKKEGVRDILFLAREGLYLKKLFDHYLEKVALGKEDNIRTHYFKVSRQASLLVSMKDIDEEKYTFLRRKYPDLSLKNFLKNFTFSQELITLIISELNFEESADKVISNFLDSEVYQKLKGNETFRAAYDKNRQGQQKAFKTYLESFGIDFHRNGMHLADIGWGGSMQECLFDYFGDEVTVHGYYLGLNEIYTIQKYTPRFGLNFSIFPYPTYADNILRGNTELNEQLLSAGHGSTVSYNHLETFTNEVHNENEKRVFNEHISEIQDFMFQRYSVLLKELDPICYDQCLVQNEMTDYALRSGLLASKRKIASAMKISEGFYTNVGNFSNGMKISPKKYTNKLRSVFGTLIISPDKFFPFLLRVKPYLYSQKKYVLAYLFPSRLVYWYIKLNRKVKKSIFQKISRFKYDHLK